MNSRFTESTHCIGDGCSFAICPSQTAILWSLMSHSPNGSRHLQRRTTLKAASDICWSFDSYCRYKLWSFMTWTFCTRIRPASVKLFIKTKYFHVFHDGYYRYNFISRVETICQVIPSNSVMVMVMVHDTHTRRSNSVPLASPFLTFYVLKLSTLEALKGAHIGDTAYHLMTNYFHVFLDSRCSQN